jgi:hypothetical protein
MMKLALFVFLSTGVLAHAQIGLALHPHALDDVVFQSCDEVLSRAVQLASPIQEPAYVMELYPKSRGRVLAFPAEVTASYAARWLSSHDLKEYPYALFYFVNGGYTLRCRDIGGRFVRLSGPFGAASPLDLKLPAGNAEIWHFYFTPINNAHVLVVTEIPLDVLDGRALMAQVKELLSARQMDLYVRNDPWFLGVAPDALPYLYTDSFTRPTYAEYQATRTMICSTMYACKVGASWY